MSTNTDTNSRQYQYGQLKNSYTYSCPKTDDTYKQFSNGVNCLCQKMAAPSSYEREENVRNNFKWPLATDYIDKLNGWKK